MTKEPDGFAHSIPEEARASVSDIRGDIARIHVNLCDLNGDVGALGMRVQALDEMCELFCAELASSLACAAEAHRALVDSCADQGEACRGG